MQLLNAIQYLDNTSVNYPDKVAFFDDNISFTFSDLDKKARSLGTKIYSVINKSRERVAVLVDRTAVSLLGFFSVLEAGSCYVPVDNKMPQDRMNDILEQVKPACILYSSKDEKLAESLSHYAPVISIEDNMDYEADNALLSFVRQTVLDIDPAYMIFTSGSTGKPKGILISHRSLIDFTEWMSDYCKIDSSCTMGNQAPFYFDLSVKDIYQTLKNGCTTYILPKKTFMFPMLLVKALNDHNINTLIWATSAFRLIADSNVFTKAEPMYLKSVILGGEALQAHHVNIWKHAVKDLSVINLYGPTEVTVDCTAYRLEKDFEEGEPIPIGKACRNMEVFLMNDDFTLTPWGEPGEIVVRGAGLALGYFNDPEKTSAAFVQNPLVSSYPDRIYRTGDIGKFDADGNIIYLCRKDGQIKHMGYRIELGEIENAVSAIPDVDSNACFFDKDSDYIICCVQSSNKDVSPTYLAESVKNRLPKYMTPNVWKIYSRMPSNANGKIDRVKLKEEYFNDKG